MSTTERNKAQIIRLSHSDGKVVVEPEDEDRFVLTAQNAVKACQNIQHEQEAIRLFKEDLVLPLHEWCAQRADKVRKCFLPVPVGFVQIFVVGISERFDTALGKDIAALELSLAQKGWNVNVLQLPDAPEEELQTYFNAQDAIEIDAELEAASGKSGSQ